MESKILAGLKFDPGILIIGMLILMLVMLIYIHSLHKKQNLLEKKYRILLRGGRSVRGTEDESENKTKTRETFASIGGDYEERIKRLEKRSNQCYQKMGIVKYDAFKEMGGKLSFACALLNDQNNGFIINSIYSKEGCYNYIKEIIKGESFLPLGEEETEALETAKQCGLEND